MIDMRDLCIHCGAEIVDRRTSADHCSDVCATAKRVARKSEEIRAAKAGRCCAWCGTTLPVEMLSTAQFCSQTCRNREYSAMVAAERARERVRDCEECGVTFTPKRRTARFCSARCGKVNWDQRQGSPRR